MADSPQTADAAAEDRERQQLRAGLLGQLAHLLREVEMLEGVIGRVPEGILAGVPPSERFSIKDTFGLLASLDAEVHRPRIARIVAEEAPRFETVDAEALLANEPWAERSMEAIFARVRRARQELIDAFEAVAPEDWLRTGRFPSEVLREAEAPEPSDLEEKDLYEMVHAVCLHDTEHLRTMSRRLYESHLGPAPEER